MMIGKEIPASWSPLASGQTGPEREGRTTICLHFLHKPRKPSSLPPLYSGSTIRTFNTSCSLLHCAVYAGRRHTRVTEKPSASESSGPGNENSKSRAGGTCVSAPVCTCTRLGRLGGVCKKNTAMRCLTLQEVTLAQLHVY